MSVAPKDWINCPKKSYLIAGKFVAFKTPLDDKFTRKLKKTEIFTPDDVFEWLAKSKLNLGLWVDLTKTTRYFDSKEVTKRGCLYEKIWCEGHGSVPNWKQVQTFTETIDKFIAEFPEKIIAVHCTHGYNRTGYLIVTYLVNRMNFQIDEALKAFSNGRPPGIYREPYVQELIRRYNGDFSKHIIMKPFWVKKESGSQDLKLGSNDITSVHMPKEHFERQDRKHVSETNYHHNDRLRRTFTHTSGTYHEQDRRDRNKRRWKEFDRKRREKRLIEKSENHRKRSHEPNDNHSYKKSRHSYNHRPHHHSNKS